MVAIYEQGEPDFQLLQHASLEPSTHLIYYVFDLLELNCRDLTSQPLLSR